MLSINSDKSSHLSVLGDYNSNDELFVENPVIFQQLNKDIYIYSNFAANDLNFNVKDCYLNGKNNVDKMYCKTAIFYINYYLYKYY